MHPSMNNAFNRLIIFTRYPQPGSTKTRLIPVLGEGGAAWLQRQMTAHTVSQAKMLAKGSPVSLEVRFDGGSTTLMRKWLGPGLRKYDETQWNDYSEIDVIVAIRPNTSSQYPNKPASKLVNAWRAGIPAILGPEIAYREVRKSELDYIEAKNRYEVARAIRRLKDSPELYAGMVENGL